MSAAASSNARTEGVVEPFPASEQGTKTAAAASAAPAKAARKPRAGRFLLMAAVPLALAAGGGWWWVTGGRIQETDNAYLRQARITIAAETPGRIAEVDVAENARVATHVRSFERSQTFYDWRHYVSLIERKPGALRNGAPFETLPEPLKKL